MKYAEYTRKGREILKDGHTMFPSDVVKDLNRKSFLEGEVVSLRADLELYKGLLSVEQDDCQEQREAKNKLHDTVLSQESDIEKLRANAMPGGHGCCDICDTGGCCKAESEEE